jgi:hypothetical protein
MTCKCCATGKKTIIEKDLEYLGTRDIVENIYSATLDVILSMSMKTSRDALNSVDEDPSLIMQWIDENVAHEYLDIEDLSRAFDYISEANLYLGRIRRMQYYGFLSYVYDFLSAVSIAKKHKYGIHGKLNSPEFLKALSQRKKSRDYRDIISNKLSKIIHESVDTTSFEFFEIFMKIFRNDINFAAWNTVVLNLSEEEIDFLSGGKDTDKIIERSKEILKNVKENF